jgi:hypothetical protein
MFQSEAKSATEFLGPLSDGESARQAGRPAPTSTAMTNNRRIRGFPDGPSNMPLSEVSTANQF